MNLSAKPKKQKKKSFQRGQKKEGGSLVTTMTSGPRFPPPFNASPTYRRRQRWQSNETAAVLNNFIIATGHYQFKIHETTTTFTSYVEEWRIRKIWVWCTNYQDNSTTVSITPVGLDTDTNCFNDRDQVFTCSSRSEAEPGHMEITPARDTPLGSWHRTSTVNPNMALFTIAAEYGGASSGNWATITLDIEFEFMLNLVGNPLGYTGTTGATTVGLLSGSNIGASQNLLLTVINTTQ
jgi:hypothetical protein